MPKGQGEKNQHSPSLCHSSKRWGSIIELHNLKQATLMPIAKSQGGLTPAEDNPWYLLATLHSASLPSPLREAKNRCAWNRYYAVRLTDDDREKLKGRVPEDELVPLDEEEKLEWTRFFTERTGGRCATMPDPRLPIELNNTDFPTPCSFSGFIFFECNFNKSNFRTSVDFIESSFIQFLTFANTTFTVGVNFKKSIFDGVDFEGIKLPRGAAFFNDTRYAGHANFSHMELAETAQFHRAAFSKSADFKGTHIGGYFDFRETKVAGWAGFQGAEFAAKADFTDAKFQAPTDFDSCRFEKCPPQLEGATLHQRTNWRRVTWPGLQGLEITQVEDLTDAYSCLKLEMDKQKRHHDELMFFSKELECRKVELGNLKGLPISLFGWTCDYGQSVVLPTLWLFDLILIGWNIMMTSYAPEMTWDKALLSSIANSLGSFGVRKEIMEGLPKTPSTGMLMFLMMQGIIALILLFLIGLGLRNRFRMK